MIRTNSPAPLSVSALLQQLDIDARRVAVELNLAVVKKAAVRLVGRSRRRRGRNRQLRRRRVVEFDRDDRSMHRDRSLTIAGRTFRSRLIVGTGKYPSHAIMKAAHEASGTDMVTVAVRRVDITRKTESLLDYIDTVEDLPAAEHRRLLHRGRRDSHGAPRPRGRACRTG